MKIFKLFILFQFALIIPVLSQSKNVQESTNTEDKFASIKSDTTNKKAANNGYLIPRMSTDLRTGISNPAIGMLVFDTTEDLFYYYIGGKWEPIAAGPVQNDGISGTEIIENNINKNAVAMAALEVDGTVTATAFDAGDASGLTRVHADSLRGSMQADTDDILQWNGALWDKIPYGRYAFHASALSAQTVGSDEYDTLRCNILSIGESFEYPAGVYDNSSFAFVAPVDGIYFFEAAALWDNQSDVETENSIFIRVNNTDEVGEVSVSGGNSFFSTSVSSTLELDEGDEVRIRIYNNSNNDMDTYYQSGKYCYFSGFLVFAQ